MNLDPHELEKIIGIEFNDKSLLKKCLSHSSYINERGGKHIDSNERLEFLGDAVLEVVVSKSIYNKYKDKREGELSNIRSKLVCEAALAKCAGKIKLPKYIYLGRGEDLSGGRKRASIVSDCFEALIGAIYLDKGLEEAEVFIEKYVLYDIENLTNIIDNKTALQQVLQKKGTIPIYNLISEEGPAHNKTFTISVFEGDTMLGQGVGRTKKIAEQEAAGFALKKLQETEGKCI